MWSPFQNCVSWLNMVGDAKATMYNKKQTVDLSHYTINIPEEMFDFLKVLQQAADSGKYEENNWLKPDGKNADHKSNAASMFRHLAEHHAGRDKDEHSGLDPLLHLAVRAMMRYTRKQRGTVHPEDAYAK